MQTLTGDFVYKSWQTFQTNYFELYKEPEEEEFSFKKFFGFKKDKKNEDMILYNELEDKIDLLNYSVDKNSSGLAKIHYTLAVPNRMDAEVEKENTEAYNLVLKRVTRSAKKVFYFEDFLKSRRDLSNKILIFYDKHKGMLEYHQTNKEVHVWDNNQFIFFKDLLIMLLNLINNKKIYHTFYHKLTKKERKELERAFVGSQFFNFEQIKMTVDIQQN